MPDTRNAVSYARTLLILGRVSNVPTVWSNCLAAWWLGGGGEWGRFLTITFAATLLYIGGMFWNDAFDAAFDRQFRAERPIPSGAIPERDVWLWGFGLIGTGAVLLAGQGKLPAIYTALLVASIVVYDAIHKRTVLAPLIMAACRLFLFLAVGAAAVGGQNGLIVWSATALALYIVGLSYIARVESNSGPLGFWPCYLLAAPGVLAVVVNDGNYRWRGFVLLLALVLWAGRCLRSTFGGAQRQIGRTVAGLLAGIVLVDLLAVGGATPVLGAVLVAFFGLALVFQRFVPAT